MYSFFRALTWIAFVGACILVFANPDVFGKYPAHVKLLTLLSIFLPLLVIKGIIDFSSEIQKDVQPNDNGVINKNTNSTTSHNVSVQINTASAANFIPNSTAENSSVDNTPHMYLRKAEAGDTDAMHSLAGWYWHGSFGCKDHKRAFELYRKAALLGHNGAMLGLSICYSNGDGCVVDKTEAEIWEYQSAMQGYTRAQYFRGLSQQHLDLIEAYAFLLIAGVTDSDAQHERYKLELKLTPQQIQQGQQRARELQAQILANKK
jgi:TPR repeat protein